VLTNQNRLIYYKGKVFKGEGGKMVATKIKVSENGLRFVFAKTAEGEVIGVSKAERDVKYFCCLCGKDMILKSGEILSTHFAHKKNSKTCSPGKIELPTCTDGKFTNKYFKCERRDKVINDYFPFNDRYPEEIGLEFCFLSFTKRTKNWVSVKEIESMYVKTVKDARDGTEVKCIFFQTKSCIVRMPMTTDRYFDTQITDGLIYCDEIAEAIKENTGFTLEETYDYEVPVYEILPIIRK